MDKKNFKIKDYSSKTAEEWFSLKKWTGFLMRLPLGRARVFQCDTFGELLKIRATASWLSGREGCDRAFSITTQDDFDETLLFSIQANKKPNA